jgi:hypothetical protein
MVMGVGCQQLALAGDTLIIIRRALQLILWFAVFFRTISRYYERN